LIAPFRRIAIPRTNISAPFSRFSLAILRIRLLAYQLQRITCSLVGEFRQHLEPKIGFTGNAAVRSSRHSQRGEAGSVFFGFVA